MNARAWVPFCIPNKRFVLRTADFLLGILLLALISGQFPVSEEKKNRNNKIKTDPPKVQEKC